MTTRPPTLLEVQGERARRSLAAFFKLMWPVLEPETPLVWNWHLDAIAEHLEAVSAGQLTRLVINVPPGHAKSLSVAVMWPAWQWLRRPSWRALFASYAAELATRDSVRCRDLIQADTYQAAFRPEWSLKVDQNVKSRFQTTEKGERHSLGVGSGATGFRGDTIVVDDPLKADEFPTAAKLEKVISWWDFQMSSRLNDLATGAKVLIMQRIHQRDLAGHVLARGGYEVLSLPTEYDPRRRCVTSLGWEDPRVAEGELLFPEKFGPEVVAEAKRDLGPYGWAGQHQQDPVPQGGGIVRDDWLRYWYPADGPVPDPIVVTTEAGAFTVPQRPIRLDAHPWTELIQSWDLAFKGSEGSDPVAGHVWAAEGGDYYLLDRIAGRLDIVESIAGIVELTRRWPRAAAKLVEDKANGPAVLRLLRDQIPGLLDVDPAGGKEARLHSVAPYFAAGNVWIPHPAARSWAGEVREQLTTFPKAPHDDDVDAATQALRHLSGIVPLEGIQLSIDPMRSRWR